MAERRVTKTGKDSDGDITKLCNNSTTWSFEYKSNAIRHIENGTHTYYVNEAGYRSDVHVYKDGYGNKHLRTFADSTSKNNLDNLPNC